MPTSVAIVLLSRATDTFHGVSERPASVALTRRSVHPAGPVLLTKSGPLVTLVRQIATDRERQIPRPFVV
ncbi:hypothetical protein TNIN_102851 [Trichonephila inaurata madagascariensis]|uniref:Uncharacterized protein n=1 Tax=Trichonephila inaurata madagascariensis TaxID=2747483 RepID=A0A8X6XDK9_9ARAC|nr:hypothetical protein TNIN_102851 [Trichonephila inaurata madagascariensis]